MSGLHLLVVGMWTGLVGAEVILELLCSSGHAARTAAKVHFWLDLLIEAPLVLAVCVTGALLLGKTPPSTSLSVKLAAGAIPVVACTYSIVAVMLRYRRLDDPAALLAGRKRILLSALAVGPGLVALYLGLTLGNRV